jgi:hypothetical protein
MPSVVQRGTNDSHGNGIDDLEYDLGEGADGTSPKRAPRAHPWLRSEFVGSSDVSGVNRLPPRSKQVPGLSQELPELVWRWPVISVMNPGRSRRRKSAMQFSIKQDGRWASGEGVQNRMAVTGTPSVVDSWRATKS